MTTPNGPAVLMMTHGASLGGAERVLLMAMEESARRGYRPILACPEGELAAAARAQGFAALPFDFAWMENTKDPRVLAGYFLGIRQVGREVEQACREHDVALLHVHSPVAGLYAVHAARRLRLPAILHMHDAQPPKRLRRWAILWQARAAQRVACVSQCVRDVIIGMGVPPEKTCVLYNAVDASYFTQPATPVTLPGTGPHVGLFGQVIEWKGQHIFLDAAERLAGVLPSAHFHIVGRPPQGGTTPYLAGLKERAAGPPLAGRATLHGYQPDARGWMAAMDAVVHASLEPEAFGLVIAEAMALGKQVVATRTGGPAEIIEDGETGRLVPPGDAGALADALAAALDDGEMGRRAAATMRRRFTPERFGEGLAKLYGETLGGAALPTSTD